MMPDADFRTLAQQARARLQQIRLARIEQMGLATGPDARATDLADRSERRLRRAVRLARRERIGQMSGVLHQPWTAATPAAQDGAEPEVFGPVAPMDASDDVAIAEQPPSPGPPDDAPLGEVFGPFQPSGSGTSLPEGSPLASDAIGSGEVDPDADMAGLLTLSPRMRVDMPLTGATIDAVQEGPAPDGAIVPDPAERAAQGLPDRSMATDLAALPGAGPALVWMLQKCGIASLTDLAEADPADLVRRLGLVGQIVDVALWHRFAVARVGKRPTAA